MQVHALWIDDAGDGAAYLHQARRDRFEPFNLADLARHLGAPEVWATA